MSDRVALPTVEDVDALALAELPAFAARLAALLARTALRLQRLALADAVAAASVTEAAT